MIGGDIIATATEEMTMEHLHNHNSNAFVANNNNNNDDMRLVAVFIQESDDDDDDDDEDVDMASVMRNNNLKINKLDAGLDDIFVVIYYMCLFCVHFINMEQSYLYVINV